MTDLLAAYQAIANAGFPAVLALILYASWRGKFVWDREHDELRRLMQAQVDDLRKQLDDAITSKERWELVALRASGMAEAMIDAVKRADSR